MNWNLIYLDKVTSTNDVAKNLPSQSVVVAREQADKHGKQVGKRSFHLIKMLKTSDWFLFVQLVVEGTATLVVLSACLVLQYGFAE